MFEQDCWLARDALTLDAPFTLADVETMLAQVEPSPPALRLFHHGEVPEYAFTLWAQTPSGVPRRRLDERFQGWLADGATLVLNRVEAHSLRAAALCEEVRRFTGFDTLANAYLCCGGDGSFGAHWDTHDVVVIQLIGRKRWKVYPPTFPLPLPWHTSLRSGHHCPAAPALDVVLETGDALYLPRGFWHDVTPCAGTSLHLSVGIYTPSVLDVLGWMCRQLLAQQVPARRTAVDDAATTRDLAMLVDALKGGLAQPGLLQRFRCDMAAPDSRVV